MTCDLYANAAAAAVMTTAQQGACFVGHLLPLFMDRDLAWTTIYPWGVYGNDG
jgi:hypothetical protein